MMRSQRPQGQPRADASDQKIGDHVRTRRLRVGLTQEKLGDALGVSFQQIQKYEKGANRISASRLRQIATALDVPVTHFYDAVDGHPDDGGPNGAEADRMTTRHGLRLAQAVAKIDDPLVRERIIALVESVSTGR